LSVSTLAANFRSVAAAWSICPGAELDLKGAPGAVARFDDDVDLEAVGVAVVVDGGVCGVGAHPDVAEDERLEQQAERIEVADQPRGGCVECRGRERGVDEVGAGPLT